MRGRFLLYCTAYKGAKFMDGDRARARCWAEVDLDAVADNYRAATALLSDGAKLIPVVKGNAYGLGAGEVARTLMAQGARLFAVATVEEAVALRREENADALIMGPQSEAQFPDAVRAGARLAVYDGGQARALSRCAQALGIDVRVHFKVDTGFHRLGFDAGCAAEAIAQAAKLPGIVPEGVFTHLALHTPALDRRQIDAFDGVLSALNASGLTLKAHALDGIGLTRYPDWQYDFVRVGAFLYGMRPAGYSGDAPRNALTLKARIMQLRAVRAGELIGYDDDHPLARDSRIATIGCGYADGYARLINVGQVSVRGARANVLGRVSMDQMMADVTDVEGVGVNDEVTLVGGAITLDEYAQWANFNRNEALARISQRVPRVYTRHGRVTRAVDYMEK